MKAFLLSFLLLVSFGQLAFSQTTITGTVTDSKGQALIGAAVLVESTDRGVVTDLESRMINSGGKKDSPSMVTAVRQPNRIAGFW